MSEHIQFETNGVTVLSVPVQHGAQLHSVGQKQFVVTWSKFGEKGSFNKQYNIELHEGPWSIHAVTTEMSNQDHEKLLRTLGLLRSSLYSSIFKTHQDYSEDLLLQHGIDPKQKNVLLIKQK